ncbi:MAG: hypothetical protein F6K26_00050 [Moorea sp. SIO2I5]|nr:hypothetical protein [Moorena sp. SIO2I5]
MLRKRSSQILNASLKGIFNVASVAEGKHSAVSGQPSAYFIAVSLFYSKAPIALRARCANSKVRYGDNLFP